MRKVIFSEGEYYHVFNRGVDKRPIFVDESDYTRFYNCLFLFNDKNYRHPGGKHKFNDEIDPLISLSNSSSTYEPLTKIVSFCLMPNHFHLMLRQVEETGISTFLYRLGMGYTRYFNLRYARTGSLFESTFKANHVNRDAYLMHLPRYIHLNVLDHSDYHWRDGALHDWGRAIKALDAYRWSSHDVYSYRVQRLPVVAIDVVQKLFPDPQDYLSFLHEWAGRQSMPPYFRAE